MIKGRIQTSQYEKDDELKYVTEVVELKVTELKKEHIGQIQTYMNYMDNNLKQINQNNTIGIIVTKKDKEFVMNYCNNEYIYQTIYSTM